MPMAHVACPATRHKQYSIVGDEILPHTDVNFVTSGTKFGCNGLLKAGDTEVYAYPVLDPTTWNRLWSWKYARTGAGKRNVQNPMETVLRNELCLDPIPNTGNAKDNWKPSNGNQTIIADNCIKDSRTVDMDTASAWGLYKALCNSRQTGESKESLPHVVLWTKSSACVLNFCKDSKPQGKYQWSLICEFGAYVNNDGWSLGGWLSRKVAHTRYAGTANAYHFGDVPNDVQSIPAQACTPIPKKRKPLEKSTVETSPKTKTTDQNTSDHTPEKQKTMEKQKLMKRTSNTTYVL